jgi:hypothetical protein
MARLVDTDLLIEANRQSVRLRLDRTLTSAMINKLDPNGIHVVAFSLLIGDGDAVRTHLLCKYTDSDQPHQVWFDFNVATFNALPDSDDYKTEEA